MTKSSRLTERLQLDAFLCAPRRNSHTSTTSTISSSSHPEETSVNVPPLTAFRRGSESKPILLDQIDNGDCGEVTAIKAAYNIRKKAWNAVLVTAALVVAIVAGGSLGTIPRSSSQLSAEELRSLLIPHVQELSESQLHALLWLADEDTMGATADMNVLKERFALASLYFATNGGNWTRPLEFLSASPVCTWNMQWEEGDLTKSLGVFCEEGTVRFVMLGDNNLQGTLPVDLGLLSSSSTIWMNQNSLSGTIPSEMTALPELKKLDLYENHLTGSVPKEVGPSLVHLNLQHNELSGTISPEWGGSLTDLSKLALNNNLIGGPIPSSLGNLENLIHLRLGSNSLTGTIPSELFTIPGLTMLEVTRNNVSGDLNGVYCTLPRPERRSLTVRADCAGSDPMVQCDCCTCS